MRLQADELSVVHGTNYTYKNADKVEKLITKDSDNDSSLEGLLTFLAHDSICWARYMLSRVHPSVRHTGGSVENGST